MSSSEKHHQARETTTLLCFPKFFPSTMPWYLGPWILHGASGGRENPHETDSFGSCASLPGAVVLCELADVGFLACLPICPYYRKRSSFDEIRIKTSPSLEISPARRRDVAGFSHTVVDTGMV